MKQKLAIIIMFAGIALTLFKKYWLPGIIMMLLGMYALGKSCQNINVQYKRQNIAKYQGLINIGLSLLLRN